MEIKMQEMQQKSEFNLAKLQSDIDRNTARDQLDIALNATNNLTKERIETARLTQKDEQLQSEQFETAIRLQNEAQRNL